MRAISSLKPFVDPIPAFNTIFAAQTIINQPQILPPDYSVYLGRDGRVYTLIQPSGFFSWLIRFVHFLERLINEKTFPDKQEWLKELVKRVKDAIPQATDAQILSQDAKAIDQRMQLLKNAFEALEVGIKLEFLGHGPEVAELKTQILAAKVQLQKNFPRFFPLAAPISAQPKVPKQLVVDAPIVRPIPSAPLLPIQVVLPPPFNPAALPIPSAPPLSNQEVILPPPFNPAALPAPSAPLLSVVESELPPPFNPADDLRAPSAPPLSAEDASPAARSSEDAVAAEIDPQQALIAWHTRFDQALETFSSSWGKLAPSTDSVLAFETPQTSDPVSIPAPVDKEQEIALKVKMRMLRQLAKETCQGRAQQAIQLMKRKVEKIISEKTLANFEEQKSQLFAILDGLTDALAQKERNGQKTSPDYLALAAYRSELFKKINLFCREYT